jgi:hypothetical protein
MRTGRPARWVGPGWPATGAHWPLRRVRPGLAIARTWTRCPLRWVGPSRAIAWACLLWPVRPGWPATGTRARCPALSVGSSWSASRIRAGRAAVRVRPGAVVRVWAGRTARRRPTHARARGAIRIRSRRSTPSSRRHTWAATRSTSASGSAWVTLATGARAARTRRTRGTRYSGTIGPATPADSVGNTGPIGAARPVRARTVRTRTVRARTVRPRPVGTWPRATRTRHAGPPGIAGHGPIRTRPRTTRPTLHGRRDAPSGLVPGARMRSLGRGTGWWSVVPVRVALSRGRALAVLAAGSRIVPLGFRPFRVGPAGIGPLSAQRYAVGRGTAVGPVPARVGCGVTAFHPTTSWRLQVRRARSTRHYIEKSLRRGECPLGADGRL